MNSFTTLARAAVIAAAFFGTAAFADPLPLSSVLTAADPIQHGRLSRNGIQQDTSGTEPFPGVINPTTSYHYHVYSVAVGDTPFLQIEIDSNSATTFLGAYQSAYFITNFAATWLGDPGTSENFFTNTDPLFFSVAAAPHTTVLLVVNETTTNGGLNQPFSIFVQGGTDSDFNGLTDLAITSGGQVIPEPSTALLLLAPLVGAAALRRRRRAVKAA